MLGVKDGTSMVEVSDLEFVKLTGVISSVFKSVKFGEKVDVSH